MFDVATCQCCQLIGSVVLSVEHILLGFAVSSVVEVQLTYSLQVATSPPIVTMTEVAAVVCLSDAAIADN